MIKTFNRLRIDIMKLVGFVTLPRVKRLWYYLRIAELGIAISRIYTLLKDAVFTRKRAPLYCPSGGKASLVFQSFTNPLVSILIPVFNQWEVTRNCLTSILENSQSLSYEIIVADDGSEDETTELPRLAPGVRHVVNPSNLGFLHNCNNAARLAKSRFLLLLNNDTTVQPGWITSLIHTVESDATVSLVGPMLLYPNGQVQEAGGIIWTDASGWNYGRHAIRLAQMEAEVCRLKSTVSWRITAPMRAAWNRYRKAIGRLGAKRGGTV